MRFSRTLVASQDSVVSGDLDRSVASVTTAYNGAGTLARHIDALLRLTRPLEEIIIVENASTDETISLLRERYPQVTVLPMADNLGPGGALARGLEYAALESKHDWIWTFDQDSVPAPDSLEILLEEAHRLKDHAREVGIIAALPVDKDLQIAATPWLWRGKFVKPPAEFLSRPVFFADLVITSGCMVRKEMVGKIGLPRPDFFVDFVDYEYCLRARSHGYKIAVATRAKLRHEVGKAHKVRFLLGRRHLWSERRPFREYYYSRNLAYLVWWLYPSPQAKGFALLHLARHSVGMLLFGPERIKALKKMLQGLWDGCQARLGARFRPDY
jgi:rhamnosyltransferase